MATIPCRRSSSCRFVRASAEWARCGTCGWGNDSGLAARHSTISPQPSAAKNEKHQEKKKRQCCCDADPGLVSRPPAEIHGMDCTGSKGSHLLNPSNRSDRVILSSRSNVFSALDRGM